jgi:hypothetical protein
VKTD